MRKSLINSFLAITLIVIGYGSMKYLKSQKKNKPSVSYKAPKTQLDLITIENTTQLITLTHQGRVINKTSITINPEVSGKVVWAATINEGQSINKGQLLFKLDETSIELQLRTLKSEFLQQFATILIDLEVDYPEQKNKWTSFFNDIKIKSNLPQLPSNISNKEKNFLASRGIYKQYYSIQQQEYVVSKHKIISPFSGVVSKINTKIGSVVSPNTSLLTLSKNNSLEIKVSFPSSLINYIKINDRVTYGGVEEGSIETIIDANTQSINVYIKPKNISTLKEGKYESINFPSVSIPKSVKLPLSTVYNGNDVVIVLDDSTTATQKLNILHKSSTHIYTNSLKNKTKVIKSIGQDFIIGQKIK